MKEIETRILEINIAMVMKKLETLGARKIYDGLIEDVYFDLPGQILHKAHKRLRLRKKTDGYTITLKERIEKTRVKVKEENETTVGDGQTMETILNGLGLSEERREQKHRVSYMLKGIHFEIDSAPGIPPVLEIEGNEKVIGEYIQLFGFSWEDAKPWSWREVQEHYSTKRYFF